jgi:carbon-monoxide dehydrogenase large subunit
VSTEAPPREKLLGMRVPRVEDPRMLVGAARYVADLEMPRLCEATFVRSPVAHGTVVSIDASEALASPGVIAVLTGADLEGVKPLTDLLELEPAVKTPRPALASERVRYVGEPVAMVVASDRYLAEDAAERVFVEIDELDPVTDVEAAMTADVQLFDHVPGNVCFRDSRRTEGTEAAFAAAAHVVSRTVHINRQVPSALEARGVLASFDPGAGELGVWLSSQAPFQQRYLLSLALGLPESLIRVTAPDVGGAFGPKDFVFPEDICVCRAAIMLGRPVRWSEDRQEALTAASQSKEQTIELELALSAEGRIEAIRGRFVGDTGAFSYSAPGGLIDTMLAATSLPGPYSVPEYDYEVIGVLTNKAPVAPYRGVGYTSATTARELLLDDAARELGIDRAELRRRNLLGPEPTTTVSGQEYDGGSYGESLEVALEAIDWEGFGRRRAAARSRGRELGIGVAPFVEMTSMGARSGRQVGLDVMSHDHAWVEMDLTGFVTVGAPTCSHGQGHATTYAQIVADSLGVGVGQVRVIDRDTARAPWGMGTFASRSAVFGGGAVMKASAILRERLLQVASLLLEAPPEALELDDGFAGIHGVPEAKIPLAGIAGAAHFDPGVRAALGESGLRATAFHDSPPAVSNGCMAVEVEVDAELCQVTLTRAVAVEDCGVILNPLIVDGQIRGGYAQGVGAALLEDYVYSESGQPQTTTFMDYLLPRASELVGLEISHLTTPSSATYGGMKGMAEGSSVGTPAAVLGAVADALSERGFRVGRLPLGPQSIFESLREAEAR